MVQLWIFIASVVVLPILGYVAGWLRGYNIGCEDEKQRIDKWWTSRG